MRAQLMVVGLIAITIAIGTSCFGGGLVINEVAWAGTAASPSDEWIELYNASTAPIVLSGWTITFGTTVIKLDTGRTQTVAPGEYFLLERTNDDTVADVPADIIYKGTLSNAGTVITLLNPAGEVVDTANAGQEKGWTAGSAGGSPVSYASMERIDPTAPDTTSNWSTNDGTHRTGHDAAGTAINGTPKAKNSATIAAETVPQVTITAPSSEGEVVTATYVIAWTAHDPDGDDAALKIDIYLSDDGRANWTLLVEGLANSGAYAWDTTGVDPGDNYRMKLVATDPNALFGVGESPLFTVSHPG